MRGQIGKYLAAVIAGLELHARDLELVDVSDQARRQRAVVTGDQVVDAGIEVRQLQRQAVAGGEQVVADGAGADFPTARALRLQLAHWLGGGEQAQRGLEQARQLGAFGVLHVDHGVFAEAVGHAGGRRERGVTAADRLRPRPADRHFQVLRLAGVVEVPATDVGHRALLVR